MAVGQVAAWRVFGSIGLEGLQTATSKLKNFIGIGSSAGVTLRNAFLGIGAAAGVAAGAVVTAIGVKAVSAFADFQAELTQATAILDRVTTKMRRDMRDAALNVARSTQFASSEAAEAFFFLESAGLNVRQSIAALPQVAAFAQAGMFDLAQATELATDAQASMGLQSEDAQENLRNLKRVTDQLVGANTLANATVEEFSQALTNKLGARARSLNIPLSETVATLGALANQGQKGRRAGSRLSILLRDLARAAVQNEQAFQRANIAVFNQAGALRDVSKIIGDFEESLGSLSEQQKIARLEALDLTRRARSMLLMLMGTSDSIAEMRTELSLMGGKAQEVARRQLDTLSGRLGQLGSMIKSTLIGPGGAVGGPLESAVEGLINDIGIASESLHRLQTDWRQLNKSLQNEGVDLPGWIQFLHDDLGLFNLESAFGGGLSGVFGGVHFEEAMKIAREEGIALKEALRDLRRSGEPLTTTFGRVTRGAENAAEAIRMVKRAQRETLQRDLPEWAKLVPDDVLLRGMGPSAEDTARLESLVRSRVAQQKAEQFIARTRTEMSGSLQEQLDLVNRQLDATSRLKKTSSGAFKLSSEWKKLQRERLRLLNRIRDRNQQILRQVRETIRLGGGAATVPLEAQLSGPGEFDGEGLPFGEKVAGAGGMPTPSVPVNLDFQTQQGLRSFVQTLANIPTGALSQEMRTKIGQALQGVNVSQLPSQAGLQADQIARKLFPDNAEARQKVTGKIKGVLESSTQEGSQVAENLARGVGQSLISGIMQGSINGRQILQTALSTIMSFVLGPQGPLFGSPVIGSVGVGRGIVEGIAVGVEGNQSRLERAVAGTTKRALAAAKTSGAGGIGVPSPASGPAPSGDGRREEVIKIEPDLPEPQHPLEHRYSQRVQDHLEVELRRARDRGVPEAQPPESY